MGMPFTADQVQSALASIKAEIAEIQDEAARRVKKLQGRADMFQEMLGEMNPVPAGQAELIPSNGDATNLRTLISSVIADGRPHDLQELVAAATTRGCSAHPRRPGGLFMP